MTEEKKKKLIINYVKVLLIIRGIKLRAKAVL